LRKPIPASAVYGTPNFYERLNVISDKRLRQSIEECLDAIKRDLTVGVKIPQAQWPRYYVTRYGISNLYKCDLYGGHRLTYTITVKDGEKVGLVLEEMSHDEYNRRFGYTD
jgi:hypothetical protein